MYPNYYAQSDQAIARILGRRLRALRLRKNRTQEEVADSAAISVGTLKALESGKGKLETVISVLRELGALDSLASFIPEPAASPLQLAHRQGRPRRRASGKRRTGLADDAEVDTEW